MKKLLESIKERRENAPAVIKALLKVFIPTLLTLAVISLGASVVYILGGADFAQTLAHDCALCLKSCFGVAVFSLVVAYYAGR